MGRAARLNAAARGSALRLAPRPAGAGGIHVIGAPRPTKVALGYPYGGSVTGPFHLSVLALTLYELSLPEPRLHLAGHAPESGLYVEDNRQRITEKFFADPARPEWLLQVDTDIRFRHTLIEQLLQVAGRDKKVLAASVPLGPPLPSSAWRHKPDHGPGVWVGVPSEEITAEGIRVDGLATAVILIHRDVVEAIAEREGHCWFLRRQYARLDKPTSREAWMGSGPMRDREFINEGEDLSFCDRAADAGFAIWCCKISGLQHNKTLPMSHDFETPELLAAAAAADAADRR